MLPIGDQKKMKKYIQIYRSIEKLFRSYTPNDISLINGLYCMEGSLRILRGERERVVVCMCVCAVPSGAHHNLVLSRKKCKILGSNNFWESMHKNFC